MTQKKAKRGIHVDEFRLFHEQGLFLPTRTIFMGPETNEDVAEAFVKNMHVLEAIAKDPITVVMNNTGGDEYHGYAMFDAITESKCHVKVVVRGHAMSMGSIILQAADERVMGPLSCQMIHYGYTSVAGHHAKTAEKWAAQEKRTNEWMERMYLDRIWEKHPDYDIAMLKDLLDHDTFLNAKESIDLGLADSIG